MATYREELKYLQDALEDLEKQIKSKGLLDGEMSLDNDEMLEEAYDKITTVCNFGF